MKRGTLEYAIWYYGKWKIINTKASLFNSNALVIPEICAAAGKWWELDIFTLLVGTGDFPLDLHCSLISLEILFQFNQILDGERGRGDGTYAY